MKDFLFILISLSMTTLFSIVYFINKLLETKQNKKLTLTFDVLLGIITLLIYVGNSEIYKNRYVDIDLYVSMAIPLIIVLSLMTSLPTTLAGLITFLIYQLTLIDGNTKIISYILTPLVLIGITIFALTLKNNSKKMTPYSQSFILLTILYSITSIITIIDVMISSSKNISDILLDWKLYFKYIYEYFMIIFILLQIYLINKIYEHTLDLSSYSVFEYESYYRLSLVKNIIHQNIIQNKNNRGIMVVFRIHYQDEEKNTQFLDEISNEIKKINEDTIFFKTSIQDWAFFIPWNSEVYNLKKTLNGNWLSKREHEDFLYNIDLALNKVLRKIGKSNIKIEAGASIYGIHSESIDELLRNCDFMIIQQYVLKRTHNIIMLFDFDMFYQNQKINNNIRKISNIINFDDIQIKFKDIKVEKEIISKPITYYKGEDKISNNFQNKINVIKKENLFSIYKRMMAIYIIDEYKKLKIKNKLLLEYPIPHMIDNYNVEHTIKKILSRKINPKSVIFSFDIYENKLLHSRVIKSIEDLKNNNINIAINNIDYDFKNSKILNNIKPKYLIFNLDNTTDEYVIKLK